MLKPRISDIMTSGISIIVFISQVIRYFNNLTYVSTKLKNNELAYELAKVPIKW